MDIVGILNSIRDPAIFAAVASLVIYIIRNYLTKEAAHTYRKALESTLESIKEHTSEIERRQLSLDAERRISKLENDVQSIKSEYVSKEKLSDVLKPIHDSLSSIKEMLEKYVTGGDNRRGN